MIVELRSGSTIVRMIRFDDDNDDDDDDDDDDNDDDDTDDNDVNDDDDDNDADDDNNDDDDDNNHDDDIYSPHLVEIEPHIETKEFLTVNNQGCGGNSAVL
jgi:hypothetical protein